MVRRIVIRKAELLAGEPVIEVFRINQSNLRAALRFGTVFAVLMALRFLPDSPLVVQWAAALAVSYLVFVLLDPGAYIAFTATGAGVTGVDTVFTAGRVACLATGAAA